MNCPMCHESSTAFGKHGNLNADFLDTFHYGTELAIGGGNPLSHPDLEAFLEKMKARGVICNLTLNEEHFLREQPRVEKLLEAEMIRGLGISVSRATDETTAFAKRHGTVVFHAICGLTDKRLLEKLYNKNLKLLFLGYKRVGRGAAFYDEHILGEINSLKNQIKEVAKKFDIVSFDNLAIEQLELRGSLPSRLFDERYMGDDGSASMYIDLVKEEFAVSSTAAERFPVLSTVRGMFETVKKVCGKNNL